MILGDTCAECGGQGAGARQLCPACEPLYAALDPRHDALVTDECLCADCIRPAALRTQSHD
jgi:hypothetical protein